MNLKLSGRPFPLMKRIILIFSIMTLASSTKYRRENRKNSTLNSEYSKNRKICKNSENSLTCNIYDRFSDVCDTTKDTLKITMRSSSARAKDPKLLLLNNLEPRHLEIIRPSFKIKGLGEETLASTSSSSKNLLE